MILTSFFRKKKFSMTKKYEIIHEDKWGFKNTYAAKNLTTFTVSVKSFVLKLNLAMDFTPLHFHLTVMTFSHSYCVSI